jgi:hypothetical protein
MAHYALQQSALPPRPCAQTRALCIVVVIFMIVVMVAVGVRLSAFRDRVCARGRLQSSVGPGTRVERAPDVHPYPLSLDETRRAVGREL